MTKKDNDKTPKKYKLRKNDKKKNYKVTENSDRDDWMKAKEAKDYGMVDEVLENNSK